MESTFLRCATRHSLAIGLASSLLLGVAATPALADDDGFAPIWTGLSQSLGFNKSAEPTIDYRERGRLVLPPKMALPAPAAAPEHGNPAWPKDADLAQHEKDTLFDGISPFKHEGRRTVSRMGPNSTVTVRATAGQGPGLRPCPGGKPAGSCGESTSRSSLNMNPLTWIGLEKKPATVLGPEPDRDWLTDPPKGYRAPVEGVGALADTN
jgi:hypothetical protein